MTYLDHAATTPMLPEARDALVAALGEHGNPSSLHASGRRARRAVEESRERIAAAIGCRPSEVIFTSGGTESDNLAVKGIFWSRRDADPARTRVLTSAIEHHAILDTVEWLTEHERAAGEFLPVDAYGRLTVDTLQGALAERADRVAVISVQWANNEVGTVQPIPELAELAHQHGIPFHTDAVQAVAQVAVDPTLVDALTLTGHKLGGPVGVGALVLGRQVAATPVQHGGGQERDVRSGTLDTAGIVSFSVAVDAAVRSQPERTARVRALRDDLIARVRDLVPDAILNGDPTDRLPGNAHFSFPGCEGDALLMLLDAAGVECSTGSACSAGVAEPSHVLVAMGADPARARSSLRFSLGHTSVPADVDALVKALPGAVERSRRATGG
ncbi:cysteine desulfurase family protein [Fodinicola feengrottensis]|uniref:cysteine desulfurase n=1 Tax=Fodinicola feengrottensis TaxID=435914 RepID=A0ABN2H8V8_9ACTN